MSVLAIICLKLNKLMSMQFIPCRDANFKISNRIGMENDLKLFFDFGNSFVLSF